MWLSALVARRQPANSLTLGLAVRGKGCSLNTGDGERENGSIASGLAPAPFGAGSFGPSTL